MPDPRPERDACIAATALTRGWAVVTRNVHDLASTRARVLDPWTDRAAGLSGDGDP